MFSYLLVFNYQFLVKEAFFYSFVELVKSYCHMGDSQLSPVATGEVVGCPVATGEIPVVGQVLWSEGRLNLIRL